ncbi:MAG: hypothetical protein ACJA0C_000309 [Candidatus Endobugula sp.]|jgi:hypothetical protein
MSWKLVTNWLMGSQFTLHANKAVSITWRY